jgi:hypothetical protein
MKELLLDASLAQGHYRSPAPTWGRLMDRITEAQVKEFCGEHSLETFLVTPQCKVFMATHSTQLTLFSAANTSSNLGWIV